MERIGKQQQKLEEMKDRISEAAAILADARVIQEGINAAYATAIEVLCPPQISSDALERCEIRLDGEVITYLVPDEEDELVPDDS
jgi:hypothetical protein